MWWAQSGDLAATSRTLQAASGLAINLAHACPVPSLLPSLTGRGQRDSGRRLQSIQTFGDSSGNTQPRVPQNTGVCELCRMCPRSQKTKSSLQRRHRRAAVPQIVNTDSRASTVLEELRKREVAYVKIPFIQQKTREGCFVRGVQKDSSGHPLEHAWHLDEHKDGQAAYLTHYRFLAHGARERNPSSGRGQRRSIF